MHCISVRILGQAFDQGAVAGVAQMERSLRQPAPLFKKLDESVVEEEYARLEA